MAKFELLCSKDQVAVIKIGNSIYYVDLDNHFDVLVYDSEFNKQNIIVPEYWLPEVTRGEATLAVLKASMTAYENGFNAGYSIKSKRHFKHFAEKLAQSMMNPELAKRIVQLFWVELRPFDVIKDMVAKIVSNEQIRSKTARASRMTLDRYIPRAAFEGDKEYRDKIFTIIQDMEPVTFDPTDELLNVLDLEDTDVPHLIQNIDKIVGLRTNARTE